jgi:L-lactate dehydrogenase complex protein LldG
MTSRAVFLDRLRSAIGAGAPEPHRPLAPVDHPPPVEPRWPDADIPMVERWARAFSVLGGHVHRTTEAELASAIAMALAGRGPVLVDERLGPADGPWLRWPSCGLEVAATAQCGVVEATAAIAVTGTLVVDTNRSGRLVSLLPPVAVFVVRLSSVVPLTGDVLRSHGERWAGGPPTNVVLITGPSRSGDIEMSLVVGVHGPGEVHAVLVDDR